MEKKFRILIYEDSEDWAEGFKFNLTKKFKAKGVELSMLIKIDDGSIQQDIEFLPDLILVDYDLGTLTGEEVLDQIENDPNFKNCSIFLYSGGESIKSLKEIASRFKVPIPCYTKQGNDLEKAVLKNGGVL